ncbi:MAG: helix-turn-helix domain-containing protein [Acidimicrobiales bacterium]
MGPTRRTGDEALGRRLRRLRGDRGLSVVEVMDACTLPTSALGAYERGDRVVPAERLTRLCAYYGVPVADVLGTEPGLPRIGGDPARVHFDFHGLDGVRSKEAKAAARVIGAIRQRRSTVRPSDGVFLIRRDDLFTIGAMVGMSVDALVDLLRAEGALRNPAGRPSKARSGPRR